MQGVDVWLNTPRRPYEASGTSGMKAAANGVLNCSILDGWWVEGYDLDHDTRLGDRARRDSTPTRTTRTTSKARRSTTILEKQIVPLFYQRGVDNIPREWIARMKNCMRKLAPVFNTNRMVREYCRAVLRPGFHARRRLLANGQSQARHPAGALQGCPAAAAGAGINIVGVHTSGNGHFKVGEEMQVEALVDLPGTEARGVAIQLYCRPDQRAPGRSRIRSPVDEAQQTDGAGIGICSSGRIDCRTSGRQGFAMRVLPGNQDLATPFEPGLIIWN